MKYIGLTTLNCDFQEFEVFNFQDVQHCHVKHEKQPMSKEVSMESHFHWAEGQKGSQIPWVECKKGLLLTHSSPNHLLSLSLTTKQFPADAKADYPWWADFPYSLFTFDLHTPHWPVL
jgi:hypothetical protein